MPLRGLSWRELCTTAAQLRTVVIRRYRKKVQAGEIIPLWEPVIAAALFHAAILEDAVDAAGSDAISVATSAARG